MFQWQRGHRHGPDKRWPDATIEIVGPRGVINTVYALEISLQTDITRIGGSPRCRMSMGKASQLAVTAAVLAAKPAYAGAEIRYWYLCPWEPIQESQNAVLAPLQNMRGTDNVVLCWIAVEHAG